MMTGITGTETYIFTFGSVLIVSLLSLVGVFTLPLKEKTLKSTLLFLVSFSAGALFGDAFIHLVPEAVSKQGFSLTVSFGLLAGIVFFFILEKFIHWRHCHVPTSEHHPHPLAVMNIIGDGVHNFLDGLVIGGSYIASMQLGIATTIAVILHEIPQEIGDFGVLLHAGFTKKKALFFNFISALTAVAGAIVAFTLAENAAVISGAIIPFTAGGFIYIAGSDLIPELHKETDERKSAIQLMSFVLGIAVMAALIFLE